MYKEGEEVHSETDEARGGSTPHIVRWILIISTLAAIVLLSAIWIFGAASQGDIEEEITASEIISETEGRDGEMYLAEDADEFAPETQADMIEAEDRDTVRTIPN